MNLVACFGSSKNLNPRSAGPVKAAEQELAAFFNAVKQLFGREQAELSAKDWLDELAKIDGLSTEVSDFCSLGGEEYESCCLFWIYEKSQSSFRRPGEGSGARVGGILQRRQTVVRERTGGAFGKRLAGRTGQDRWLVLFNARLAIDHRQSFGSARNSSECFFFIN